jgi:hypothetical protein
MGNHAILLLQKLLNRYTKGLGQLSNGSYGRILTLPLEKHNHMPIT